MRCTIAQAWDRISTLAAADAGRLTGYTLLDNHIPPIPAGTLAGPAAQQLHENLYRDADTAVGGDSIAYVVCSDDTPVAWVTYHARVIAPAAELSDYQIAHQMQAIDALSRLSRRALADLARRRDHREQRDPGTKRDIRHDDTSVLVADPDEPTLSWWTSLPADLEHVRIHLAALTGGDGDALVLDACGYGAYGLGSHRLPVPVLCTIDALAAEHDLPAWVIGDWLKAEGAPPSLPSPDTVRAEFTRAYLGLFPHQRAYARIQFQQRGWDDALNAAAIPQRLFDLDRFTADLFCDEVREIRFPHGQIAVFRRTTR